jgi:uncharacterized protein with FMN-binding domain
MIRTTAVPRPARAGAALVGVAGILALAGCAGGSTTADGSGSGSTTDVAYKDGTYTAEGTYSTPESVETISVTVTLADDKITDVEVTGDPQKPESQQYQSQFIGGISTEVVGKDIDQISVSRVAGSSLTSSGFNQAIAEIKQQAAA